MLVPSDYLLPDSNYIKSPTEVIENGNRLEVASGGGKGAKEYLLQSSKCLFGMTKKMC